jgi:two-component system CheB/CheR fusion protein
VHDHLPRCVAAGAREGHGVSRPIDQFFRALAEDARHQAIGVILSGTASDGTLGLEAIKAEGGITFAQDETAQHEGMPQSAIASVCVDFVLPPDDIARDLVRIAQHPHAAPRLASGDPPEEEANLTKVVRLLQQATGVDFTHYKVNTFSRRSQAACFSRKWAG